MGAVYNPETKRMEQVEGVGNNNNAGVRYVSYHVGEAPDSTAEELATLLRYAKEDGFELNGDSDKGRKAKEGKAIKQYVRIAIAEFIASRDKLVSAPKNLETPAEETPETPAVTPRGKRH